MATLTPPATSTEAAAVRAGISPRPLWQAPLFVVGVAALAFVWLVRPFASDDGTRQAERDLNAARSLLGRSEGDPQKALTLAQRALDRGPQSQAGEAHYLLGSAEARLAERATPNLAPDHWRQARAHLEEAERLGVSENDRGRLAYRRAKVGFRLGEDPQTVVNRLRAAADLAEDPAEAYSLLTQAYLRLPQPNLKEALKANEHLRTNLPRVPAEVLAPAQLQGGELLLRLKKPDEARKVLEKIGPQAPAAIRAEARVLLARSFQEEKRYADAATRWQAALKEPPSPTASRAAILYNLGLCQREQEQPTEAAKSWEKCVQEKNGDEIAAAALGLAELRLKGADPEPALDAYEKVVSSVQTPADWHNRLIDLATVRESFARAGTTLQEAKRYDLVLRLAAPYAKVAEPGKAALLKARAADEGGTIHLKNAREARDETGRQAEESAARDLFLQAAAAYAEVAAVTRPEGEHADFLWLSAARYLDGQDYAKARAALDSFLKLEQGRPEDQRRQDRLGEGWFVLGEVLRQTGDGDAALTSYREAVKFASPFARKALYQLALAAMESGQLDDAETMLDKQILKEARDDNDAEAQEKALYALGGLYFKRHKYQEAQRKLDEALGRFKDSPEAVRARYQLAESYRQLASPDNLGFMLDNRIPEETRKRLEKEHDLNLLHAAEEFERLMEILKSPEAARNLTPEELAQVPFSAADCRFDLAQYVEALAIYDRLVGHYSRLIDGAAGQYCGVWEKRRLDALGGTVRCHFTLSRQDDPAGRDLHTRKLRERLAEVRAALAALDLALERQWTWSLGMGTGMQYLTVSDEALRRRWGKWLDDCEKAQAGQR
jgi:tetratricopeptide (TPR) repeat protein